MRLDRFISQQLVISRKHATALIRGGQVCLDDVAVKRASTNFDPATTTVTVAGETVGYLAEVTLLVNKPAGLISATKDSSQPTIMSLVPPEYQRPGLAPAGRLDKDTTGLLILTTDGQLNHALTHPGRHVDKIYRAHVGGEELLATPEAELAQRFAEGMALEDGTVCLPARFVWREPGVAEIVLREGRTHQVKRMIAASGGEVLTLHRESIGALALPPDLAGGECRLATADELEQMTRRDTEGLPRGN